MPNINIFVAKKLHSAFKAKCATQGKKIKVVIVELIEKFIVR